MISMDLNASPLPEDDEDSYREHLEDERVIGEHIETSVETMRREREERRRRLQRENQDEGSRRVVQRNNMIPMNNRPPTRVRTLPEGWLDCPPCGQNIGWLIPSKVPLDESYNDAVPPGRRYSSRQVIQQQKRAGREIGLVIDLTNSNRYYSPSEWTRQGIKHVKIACKGRDSAPDNESVNIFFNEVFQFLSRSKKKFVLVHCTHGHNRTGYMIISYIMRSQLIYLTEAIQAFANARPPGIYKPDYIDALYLFYHERKPDAMICPSTPEWKRSSDLDLNGEAMQDGDDDGGGGTPILQNVHVENEMTNDDVLGDAIPYDQQEALQKFCYSALKLPLGGRGRSPFPGSHPVSLNRDNLQLLRTRYYYATWKADGTRYMMLITYHGCYLIDRNFSFRRVQLRFPMRNTNEGLHNLTLIDGEMIIDRVPFNDPTTGKSEKKLERRYLAYDLMVLNSESVIERPFSERWRLLEKEVIEPRNSDRRQNPIYRYDLEPFRVRRKDFWLLSTVTKLLKEFIPALSHEADGLIFQGWDDPYVTRTHEGLLKWKYPSLNSVDFLFEVEGGRQMLCVFERGRKKLLDGARVKFSEEVEDVSEFSGKIIECSYDREERMWLYLRTRTDKSTPNDIGTYHKVRKSIEDNITEEVVLNEIAEIVQLPMYADRMQHAEHKKHQIHLAEQKKHQMQHLGQRRR